MNGSTTAVEHDASKEKTCIVCAETIRSAARKCTKCGSYQDRRRYLDYNQPWIPWLIAATTSIFSVFTYLSKVTHSPNSNLEISTPRIFNDEAQFVIANSGDRTGIIDNINFHFAVRDAGGGYHYFRSGHKLPSTQSNTVAAGEQRTYSLLLSKTQFTLEYYSDTDSFLASLKDDGANFAMMRDYDRCKISVTIQNFRSQASYIESPIRCYDLAAYVNNYLIKARSSTSTNDLKSKIIKPDSLAEPLIK